MALRHILGENEPALLKKSRKVTDFNSRLHELIDDMRETMLEANGVGLAAPQVGVLRRVIVVLDTTHMKEGSNEADFVIELVNPEIIEVEGEQIGLEGCLSIPGKMGTVKRPMRVKVKAQDRYGKEFFVVGGALTARAFCHEIDHLNGILYTTLATEMFTNDQLQEMENSAK